MDVAIHPPKKKLRTVEADDQAPRFHWTSIVALAALIVFWAVAGPAAALIAIGHPVGYGLAGLAGSSLVVAYLMGSE